MSASAAGVAVTFSSNNASDEKRPARTKATAPVVRENLEEAELLRAVANQHVLGLLVVIEHHLVRLAADAGLLVAAKGRMRGIGVIAVGPDPAGLDRAAEPVGAVAVAGPDTGAEAVERVV